MKWAPKLPQSKPLTLDETYDGKRKTSLPSKFVSPFGKKSVTETHSWPEPPPIPPRTHMTLSETLATDVNKTKLFNERLLTLLKSRRSFACDEQLTWPVEAERPETKAGDTCPAGGLVVDRVKAIYGPDRPTITKENAQLVATVLFSAMSDEASKATGNPWRTRAHWDDCDATDISGSNPSNTSDGFGSPPESVDEEPRSEAKRSTYSIEDGIDELSGEHLDPADVHDSVFYVTVGEAEYGVYGSNELSFQAKAYTKSDYTKFKNEDGTENPSSMDAKEAPCQGPSLPKLAHFNDIFTLNYVSPMGRYQYFLLFLAALVSFLLVSQFTVLSPRSGDGIARNASVNLANMEGRFEVLKFHLNPLSNENIARLIGVIIGGAVFGYICDAHGRRRSFQVAQAMLMLNLVFTVACGSTKFSIAVEFVGGLFSSGIVISLFLWLGESTSFGNVALFNVATLILPLSVPVVMLGEYFNTQPSLWINAMYFSIVLLCFVVVVAEVFTVASPTWMFHIERNEACSRGLNRIASINDGCPRNLELVVNPPSKSQAVISDNIITVGMLDAIPRPAVDTVPSTCGYIFSLKYFVDTVHHRRSTFGIAILVFSVSCVLNYVLIVLAKARGASEASQDHRELLVALGVGFGLLAVDIALYLGCNYVFPSFTLIRQGVLFLATSLLGVIAILAAIHAGAYAPGAGYSQSGLLRYAWPGLAASLVPVVLCIRQLSFLSYSPGLRGTAAALFSAFGVLGYIAAGLMDLGLTKSEPSGAISPVSTKKGWTIALILLILNGAIGALVLLLVIPNPCPVALPKLVRQLDEIEIVHDEGRKSEKNTHYSVVDDD